MRRPNTSLKGLVGGGYACRRASRLSHEQDMAVKRPAKTKSKNTRLHVDNFVTLAGDEVSRDYTPPCTFDVVQLQCCNS